MNKSNLFLFFILLFVLVSCGPGKLEGGKFKESPPPPPPPAIKTLEEMNFPDAIESAAGIKSEQLLKDVIKDIPEIDKQYYVDDLEHFKLSELGGLKVAHMIDDKIIKEEKLNPKIMYIIASKLAKFPYNISAIYGLPKGYQLNEKGKDKENRTAIKIIEMIKEKLTKDLAKIEKKPLVLELVKYTIDIDWENKGQEEANIRKSIIEKIGTDLNTVLHEYEDWFNDKPWFPANSEIYKFIVKRLRNVNDEAQNAIDSAAVEISKGLSENLSEKNFDEKLKETLENLGLEKGYKVYKQDLIYAKALNRLFAGKTRAEAKKLLENEATKQLYLALTKNTSNNLAIKMLGKLTAENINEVVGKPLASLLIPPAADIDRDVGLKKAIYTIFDKDRNKYKILSQPGGFNIRIEALIATNAKHFPDKELYSRHPDFIIASALED
jgi:hypothetical protein